SIERAAVSAVYGLGGLGKTALVLHLLHRRFADRIDRTLMLVARHGVPGDQIRIDLVAVLAAALGYDHASWSGVLRHPDELVTTCIDLADEAEALVVLDDVHLAPDACRELLRAVSAYARRSRWIAIGRVHLDLELSPSQVLPLEGMAQGDLARL